VTFKKDLPNTHNSRLVDITSELQTTLVSLCMVHDRLANVAEAREEYGATLTQRDALRPADAVILALAHRTYLTGELAACSAVDWRYGRQDELNSSSRPAGIELWRL
jgi:UDP-N-acetyl-D-glucosamine/UDP-N-acetyl-D-galactosamine dehydrogenase